MRFLGHTERKMYVVRSVATHNNSLGVVGQIWINPSKKVSVNTQSQQPVKEDIVVNTCKGFFEICVNRVYLISIFLCINDIVRLLPFSYFDEFDILMVCRFVYIYKYQLNPLKTNYHARFWKGLRNLWLWRIWFSKLNALLLQGISVNLLHSN